jgi:hypothetical protein
LRALNTIGFGKMVEKRKKVILRDLKKIRRHLNSTSGVKKRHELLKQQRLLRKEMKMIERKK